MFFATKLNQMHDEYDAGTWCNTDTGRPAVITFWRLELLFSRNFSWIIPFIHYVRTLYIHLFLKVFLRPHFEKDVIIRERRRRQLEYVFLHDCYYSFHLKYFKIF